MNPSLKSFPIHPPILSHGPLGIQALPELVSRSKGPLRTAEHIRLVNRPFLRFHPLSKLQHQLPPTFLSINVNSSEKIAYLATRQVENATPGSVVTGSQSQLVPATTPAQSSLGRVGIDTLSLMVVKLEDWQSLLQHNELQLARLSERLAVLGIRLQRFSLNRHSSGSWGQNDLFKFTLSVAKVANMLFHGRRHNAYVVSAAELRTILNLIKQECARAGVHLDTTHLKVIRLDLFVDALLKANPQRYFQMLKLLWRSASLRRGRCYSNGILGAGQSYASCCYGKGKQLLHRARRGVAAASTPDELFEERPEHEWNQVVRLEIRCYRSSAVRRAVPVQLTSIQPSPVQPSCPPDQKSLQDLFLEQDEATQNGDEGVEQGRDEAADFVERMVAEPEEELPTVTVGQLLEQWDRLPEVFRKTARQTLSLHIAG